VDYEGGVLRGTRCTPFSCADAEVVREGQEVAKKEKPSPVSLLLFYADQNGYMYSIEAVLVSIH
jgi:hypothetical protein